LLAVNLSLVGRCHRSEVGGKGIHAHALWSRKENGVDRMDNCSCESVS